MIEMNPLKVDTETFISAHPDVAQWITWMQGEGMAARTVEERGAQLGRLSAAGIDLYEPDPNDVALLLSNDQWKAATKRTYYSALRAWFLWRVRVGLQPENPLAAMRSPKVPRPRSHTRIADGDLDRILAACTRHRTRAMVLLAAYEGLRVHEIAKMRGEYIYAGKLRVIGKGAVDDELPLHPLVAEIAEDFPRRGYWFPSYSNPGEPISAQSVSSVLSKLLSRAGVPATGHGLRHWYGQHTLRASGGNLRVAQEALRHATPATTALYTHIDGDELREANEKLPRPSEALAHPRRRKPKELDEAS